MAGSLIKIACVLVACMMVFAPHADAIKCRQVAAHLNVCLKYLQDGGVLPPICCTHVRRLNKAARTTADKQAACACARSYNGYVKHIKTSRALSLPSKCGVNLPYRISTRTDCSKVQ